jgi:hypothetical protein
MAGRQRSGFANDRRTYTYACCNDKKKAIGPRFNLNYPPRIAQIINTPQFIQQLVYYVGR